MARNEEKSQSMLNRFRRMKEDEEKGGRNDRRPYIAADCNDLVQADKWRMQILREMGRKVTEIQNATLGEHRIRDLNDEINKLIREKHHWEKRIIELGGPNYIATAPRVTDHDGKEAVSYGGYKYFGEARNLPGVKELLQGPVSKGPKKNRYDLYKGIDADYYGFRDDEDGLLESLESVAEKKAILDAVQDWETQQQRTADDMEADDSEFTAHVPVPTQEQIQQMIVDRRKEELMKKYVSDDLAKTVVAQ
eukprot:TRINITY_DN1977_c0_g1_i2.p1 TRINITY_DN1977_c0_g1~~TRINITY_DN1977_c0_g1_i2.p1  ORF type:complete len:250 (-),score=83.18 TRINITY_DN1977_c0_g1_i2:73-822(-)